jgi:hypothetical protein
MWSSELVGSIDALFEEDYEIVLEILEVTMAQSRITLTFALRIVSRFFSSGAAFLIAADTPTVFIYRPKEIVSLVEFRSAVERRW